MSEWLDVFHRGYSWDGTVYEVDDETGVVTDILRWTGPDRTVDPTIRLGLHIDDLGLKRIDPSDCWEEADRWEEVPEGFWRDAWRLRDWLPAGHEDRDSVPDDVWRNQLIKLNRLSRAPRIIQRRGGSVGPRISRAVENARRRAAERARRRAAERARRGGGPR